MVWYLGRLCIYLKKQKDESWWLPWRPCCREAACCRGQTRGRLGRKQRPGAGAHSGTWGSKSGESMLSGSCFYCSLTFQTGVWLQASVQGRKEGGREGVKRAIPGPLYFLHNPHVKWRCWGGVSLYVVSTGKKEINTGLLFVPGRQIPPLDPHENGNNGAIKLGKQATQASRRCCWPMGHGPVYVKKPEPASHTR